MRTPWKTYVFLALLAGAIFVLGASGKLRAITGPLSSATSGLAAPLYRVGAGIQRAMAGAAGEEQDASELEKLRTAVARMREVEAENLSLKDALKYHDENKGEDALVARVLSRTDDDAFRGILIDRGSDHGVRAGQPVVTGSGVIIGKIEDVRSRTSSVMLLLDSRSKLAVAVQDEAGTLGVLEGDRGLAMTLTLVPLTEELAPGATVVTSGLEPGVKRGLVVGTIESVSRSAQDPFQTAAITPFKSASLPVFVQVLRVPGGGGSSGS